MADHRDDDEHLRSEKNLRFVGAECAEAEVRTAGADFFEHRFHKSIIALP